MQAFIVFLIFILSLAGASQAIEAQNTDEEREKTTRTYSYECIGLEFVARIEGDKAWLILPGETTVLPHVSSASGARFGDESNLFWSKGEEAMLEWNGARYSSCRNNRIRAIWEDAKLNGVDFRAVGNELGWVLEIRDSSNTLRFVNDYGKSITAFANIERSMGQSARQTRYHAQSGEDQIEVLLTGKLCADTMADIRHETSVKVVFNNQHFSGCGQALH